MSTAIANFQTQRYVCVSTVLENDISPEGNRNCKEFGSALIVFPVYPNPVSTLLSLEWIAANGSSLVISMLDGLGQKVFDAEVKGAKGYNRNALDVSQIRNGIYYLLIDDGLTKNTQRILISMNP